MFWFRKKEIKNENDSIHLAELLKLREECNRFPISFSLLNFLGVN